MAAVFRRALIRVVLLLGPVATMAQQSPPPATPVEFQTAGDAAFERKGYPEAILAYETAAKLGRRDDAGLLLKLAFAYNEVGSYENALAVADAAIRLAPRLAAAHRERAYAQLNLGYGERPGTPAETERYAAATASYREAIRLNPASGQAFQGLGEAYRATGAIAEAARALAEAVRLIPDDGNLRMDLASVYDSLDGREQDAATQCWEAIRLDPQNYEAMTLLGQEYRVLGRLQESVAHLRAALRLKPDHADAHAQLALTLARQGNQAGARDAYRRAERLDRAQASRFAPLLEKVGVSLRGSGAVQPPGSAPCPELTVVGAAVGLSGQMITFTARLSDATPSATPRFNWTVSAGTVASGQGTETILVETTGLSGLTTTATVEVLEWPKPCELQSRFRTRILGRGGRERDLLLATPTKEPRPIEVNAAAKDAERGQKAGAGLDSHQGPVAEGAGQPAPANSRKLDPALLAAVERGESASQLKLGRMYQLGEGVPKDPKMAYFWFTVAASNGSHEAAKERDAISRTLTPKQASEGFNQAFDWIQAHGRKVRE